MINKEQWEKELEQYAGQEEHVKKVLVSNLAERIKKEKAPYKIGLNEEGKLSLIEVGESTEGWLARFISCNESMIELKNSIRKLAKVEDDPNDQLFSVLISGETGTGKELIARALHGELNGRFIAVNCAGIPSELVESLIFGHRAGSFTGATDTRDGLMKVAKNGTFFMDEVGELPLPLQGKMLRAIQERKIMKIGNDREEEINCRVVCATNKNLKDLCKHGLFRLDLYARISTFELDTLPLTGRKEDIRPIIRSLSGGPEFLDAFDKANIKAVEMGLTSKSIDEIDLSLNVRSLQQHVKRFKVLGKLPI